MTPLNISGLNGSRIRTSKIPSSAPSVTTTATFAKRYVVDSLYSRPGDHVKPNPHSYEVCRCDFLKGKIYNVNTTNAGYWSNIEGHLINYSGLCDVYFPLPPFPNNTYNDALSKCYDELRGSVDLSIDLAQLGQTARMFKAIRKIETYTKAFRSLRDLVTGVASAKLAYTYGIAPTVNTVYDCIEKTLHALDNTLLVIKQRAKSPVIFSERVNLSSFMCTVYQDPWHIVKSERNSNCCEIKMRYKTLDNALGTWTSLNPVSIAWELMPYSFVVDWFFDVGNYVRNLETSLLYRNQFVDGYVSKLSYADYVMTNENSSYYVGSGTGRNHCTYLASSTARRIRFARTVLESAPTPEMPSFKADLGSARLLNAAALLGVLLERKR